MQDTNYLIMPLEIIKGAVYEDYIYVPGNNGAPVDLTNATAQAQIFDKPGGTSLATFNVYLNSSPDGDNVQGWVRIRLDDSASMAIPTGYHRGTWTLMVALEVDNPIIVAMGTVNIATQGLVWQ